MYANDVETIIIDPTVGVLSEYIKYVYKLYMLIW